MIHVLYNLTIDYGLQMVILEKRIGNKENPLEINKLREELNLRFERLTMQYESSNERRAKSRLQQQHSLRVNATTVGCLVTSLFIVRPEEIMVADKVMQALNLLIVSTAEKTGHVKANCFILNRRNKANGNSNKNE
jgi:hypothetical protein